MLIERPAPESVDLKNHIESEIKKDEREDLSVKVAAKLLGVRSIDKEFEELGKRFRATSFVFNRESAGKALRPYQQQTIENLNRFLKDQMSTMAVQLPTGAGKTFLIHSFIYEMYLHKSKNVLIVTPSWEIANQHAMTMCQHFEDGAARVCRLGGGQHPMAQFPEFQPRMKAKVIITTSALFYARREKIKKDLRPALVIIDEGHYGWKKKRLNSIQAFAREIPAPSILLTATPPQNMENLPFAAQLRYLDLVPEFLVECQVIRLETGEEFKPVLKNGALVQKSRIEISSRQQRFEKIVADSLPHIKGQTIYYAGSVREAMGVVQEFNRHGLLATVVHSKWAAKGDKINAIAIEKFRRGETQVLVNVQMLAMGFDVPNVETIIVARPVESDTLFTQMVGRGARPSEGKDKFILIDVHDTISKPDVAKIFEHDHIFYGGQVPEPAPVVMETPNIESIVDGFPWRDPVVELDFESFHFLRSPALMTYFTEPYLRYDPLKSGHQGS